MSSLRVTVLGSSSAAGTNLADPVNERYAATFQTYLRAGRSSHCRVQVVALAGIGLYEQQATGYSTPANRVGACPVNTGVNITFALAQKPQVLILHHPAGNLPECLSQWSITTEAGLQNFIDTEQMGLVANIKTLCDTARCEFYVLSPHPLLESVLSQAQIDSNYVLGGQLYFRDALVSAYGARCLDYWPLVAGGDGYGVAGTMLVDGNHLNTTGIAAGPEAVLEAAGFPRLHNARTPLDIDL